MFENIQWYYRCPLPSLSDQLCLPFVQVLDHDPGYLQNLLCSEDLLIVQIHICATDSDLDDQVYEKGLLKFRPRRVYRNLDLDIVFEGMAKG